MPTSSNKPANLFLPQLRSLRLHGQCLAERLPHKELLTAVEAMVGVQAQLPSAMNLSLRARVGGLAVGDVDAAREQERSVVRSWVMRGTLHLVAAADFSWLMSLLGPINIAATKFRSKQLGLDEDTYAKAGRVIRKALADGPLTRAEIVQQLITHDIDPVGQRTPYLISRVALEGTICYGPDHDGEATYVPVADWLKPAAPKSREDALAELARRYLTGYGPADPADLAAWAGLPLRDARAAWKLIEAELTEVDAAGQKLWALKNLVTLPDMNDSPIVNLLPSFDNYLLGYAQRDAVVAPNHVREIYHGGQMVPALMVDGAAAGIWRTQQRGKQLEVKVTPFAGLSNAVRDGISKEAEDLGCFVNFTVNLSYVDNMRHE